MAGTSAHAFCSLAAVPGVETAQAKAIVNWNDPEFYRRSRQDPGMLVRNGIWNDAVFDKVHVARLYDGTVPVSALVIHDTASPRIPKEFPEFRRAEMKAKMKVPPWAPVPFIGRKCYAHVREIYSHPDMEDLAMVGLWHALSLRHPQQKMSMYLTPADPADKEMVVISQKLSLVETGTQTKPIAGYKSNKILRVEEKVRVVMARILQIAGIEKTISQIQVTG